MVSHGNQALIILQIPENSGILMPILELFPLSAWVPSIIWNFWKPTDIKHNLNIDGSSLYTLLQLISSKYMLSIYLCIHNICGLSIVWKFVQMKLCVLVSVYIKQRLCFHYLLGDLYSLVWSNYQLKYMKIEPPQMFNWVISYYNSSLIPFQSCLKFSELNVLEEIRHIWFIHWRIALPRNQKNMCNIRINGVYDYRMRINFRQNFN